MLTLNTMIHPGWAMWLSQDLEYDIPSTACSTFLWCLNTVRLSMNWHLRVSIDFTHFCFTSTLGQVGAVTNTVKNTTPSPDHDLKAFATQRHIYLTQGKEWHHGTVNKILWKQREEGMKSACLKKKVWMTLIHLYVLSTKKRKGKKMHAHTYTHKEN